jgi:hypothetical protein
MRTSTSGKTELDPLERRGRWWVFGSFVFCPCHLPLTLALLASVFGGTALGVVVRDHAWVAGTIVTAAWVVGTWYGFRLLRRARSGGACPLPEDPSRTATSGVHGSSER